jgi:hypothetical protein
MSIRLDKNRLTQVNTQGQGDQTAYEKLSVPFSITLPLAQEPAQNPNQPAQPTSEAPAHPSAPKPAEPSS